MFKLSSMMSVNVTYLMHFHAEKAQFSYYKICQYYHVVFFNLTTCILKMKLNTDFLVNISI